MRYEVLIAAGIVAIGMVMGGAMGRYQPVQVGNTVWVVDGLTGAHTVCYASMAAAKQIAIKGGVDANGCIRPGDSIYDF